MDPKIALTPTPAPATPPAPIVQPVPKQKSGFLAFLGKLFLFFIVGGLLLAGGYILGTKANPPQAPSQPTEKMKPSPTLVPPSPTNASQNVKTVKAGLASTTAFKPYVIAIPQGWTDVRENTETAGIDKLTISKNDYSLTVYQAALGGGGCTYKNDPTVPQSQAFSDFTQINGKSAQFRRSWNQEAAAKTITYTVCQKVDDNSYGTLTMFGRIDVVSPLPADSTVLAEIDGMIASLETQ
jgi:hypothetical protein